jgi:hypothetical protein
VSLSGKRLTDSNEFANELREKKMILPIDVTLRGSPKSAAHAIFHANNKIYSHFSTLSLIFLIISFLVSRMSSKSTDTVSLRLRTEVSKSPAPSGSKFANGNPP